MAIDRTASTSALTASAPAEAPFNFADFLRVLDERRSLIRNIMLAVSTLTLLVLLTLPTKYSSSAVVMLDQRKNNVADLSSVLSALPTDPSSVQNQIQVLSSRELAGRVIGKLKLYNDPEFNPALSKNETPGIGDVVRLLNPANWGPPRPAGAEDADYERDAIVSAFLSRLDVSALGLSTSITLTFTSRDPAKAALIANTLADAYTEDQVDTKVAAARKATQWLTDRMHQLAGQVQAAESAIAQYKAAHNLVESAQGNSLVDQQLVAINALLVAAQSDMAEKKATYDRYGESCRRIAEFAPTVAQNAKDAFLIRSWQDELPAGDPVVLEGYQYSIQVAGREQHRRILDRKKCFRMLHMTLEEFLDHVTIPMDLVDARIDEEKRKSILVTEPTGPRRLKAVPRAAPAVVSSPLAAAGLSPG